MYLLYCTSSCGSVVRVGHPITRGFDSHSRHSKRLVKLTAGGVSVHLPVTTDCMHDNKSDLIFILINILYLF